MPLKWQLVTSPYRANGNPPVIPEDFYIGINLETTIIPIMNPKIKHK